LDTQSQSNEITSPKGGIVFAVTSGKGGVGKTSISVNMATEFAGRGYRTIIIGADLGLANTHTVAGVKPTKTLSDYLAGKAEISEIITNGPNGVKFISGGSGIKDMANLDDKGRRAILAAITELKPFCDLLMLDTGAGVSSNVTDFVSIADHTILITTPNFAATADAYGIVKVMVQEGYDKPIHLLVNRVRSPEESEQVHKKLSGCTERFLGFELKWLGRMPEDTSVEGAAIKRTPFIEAFPNSAATRYLKKVVSELEKHLPPVKTRT